MHVPARSSQPGCWPDATAQRPRRHWPGRRRWLLAAALLGLGTSARAGRLNLLDQIDHVELDGDTHRLVLMVLLSDERVNSMAAIRAVYSKVIRYERYIESGQALRDAPDANPSLRPAVVLVAPRDATSVEMQNLAGVRLSFARRGAEVEVRPHIPGLTPRPRPNGAGR